MAADTTWLDVLADVDPDALVEVCSALDDAFVRRQKSAAGGRKNRGVRERTLSDRPDLLAAVNELREKVSRSGAEISDQQIARLLRQRGWPIEGDAPTSDRAAYDRIRRAEGKVKPRTSTSRRAAR